MEGYQQVSTNPVREKPRARGGRGWGCRCLRSRWATATACMCMVICVVVAYMASRGLSVQDVMDMAAVKMKRRRCAIGEANRVEGAKYGELTERWYSDKCQKTRQRCAMSPHVIDRTCTLEDEFMKLHSDDVFYPHVTPLLVSKRYMAVYVQNPSRAHSTVRDIMLGSMMASEMSSSELTPTMFTGYFFFSFVEENAEQRFVEEAHLLMGGGGGLKRNCSSIQKQLSKMLTFWKNPDIAFVHTQLFQLSPDAGRSNKMVHLDWLEYSSNLKGGIIDVLLEIQKRSLFCIPEIDFKEISSQLYYRETVAYNMTREISRCETQQLLEMVRAMYVDDIKCIKQ